MTMRMTAATLTRLAGDQRDGATLIVRGITDKIGGPYLPHKPHPPGMRGAL